MHGAHLQPIWLHTSDGQRLYAIRGGAGPIGVVLVPESPPGDVCGWLPYAATLERAGMRVVAFDYRGTGDSPVRRGRSPFAYGRDLTAAVAQLRADGAKRVAVVGASFGGAVAMTYASGVEAVVSLSGETALPQYHLDPLDAVSHLHAPLLIVGSRDDTYLPIAGAARAPPPRRLECQAPRAVPKLVARLADRRKRAVRAQGEGRGACLAPLEDCLAHSSLEAQRDA